MKNKNLNNDNISFNYSKLLSFRKYQKKKFYIDKNEKVFFFKDYFFRVKNNFISIFNNLNNNPVMIINNNEIGNIKTINKVYNNFYLCLNNKLTLFFIEIEININKYSIIYKIENYKFLFCSNFSNKYLLLNNNYNFEFFTIKNNLIIKQTIFNHYFNYPIIIKKEKKKLLIDFNENKINTYDIKTFELLSSLTLDFKITNIQKIWYLKEKKCLFIHQKNLYLIYFDLISNESFQYLSLGCLKYVEIMNNYTFLICTVNSEMCKLIKIISINCFEEYAFVPFGIFFKNVYLEFKLKKYKEKKFNVNEFSELIDLFENDTKIKFIE